MPNNSSRFPGFYNLSLADRVNIVADWAGLSPAEQDVLLGQGLTADKASQMIENGIGIHALPLGVACNFLINGRDYLIPMAVEEPSVLAAVCFAAKLARKGGGFTTSVTPPIMIGQVQVLDIPDMHQAMTALQANKPRLMTLADECNPSIVRRGGGSRDIELRPIYESPAGPMLIVHLLYDARDAMGANAINTALETIAPIIADLTGGRVNMCILSNLTDRRMVNARCVLPDDCLAMPDIPGREVAQRIAEANAFALVDPYRAATHNKGIMNGIDAVCIATGNDWRAVEAGAHAYAARDGQYRALTGWQVDDDGNLTGELTMPLAVGIVGGATKVHPTAQVALKILNVKTATELGEVMGAVGLAQNFAAIRALVTSGIQQGHMRLHARQIALAAGATGRMVDKIASQLIANSNIRVTHAKELMAQHATLERKA